MTRTLALITALLATLFTTAGVAIAEKTANTKWLNTKWLNTKWLNTADLNATNGGASFYNPWTDQTLPDVYLDRTTFVSSSWSCHPFTQECWSEEARGDDFVGTWTTATLGSGDPSEAPSYFTSYVYISGRFHPPDADPDTFVYWIHTWSPDSSGAWAWRDACVDINNQPVPAIPLAGEWNQQTGARISYGGNRFTWACTSGALGKCAAGGLPNMLGYAPWRSDWYHQPTQDGDGTWYWTSVDGQRTHQACTRMIRADYCGDGSDHTEDGNPIDVRDSLWDGHRDTEWDWPAEAVWNEHGAHWVSCHRSLAFQGQGTLTCSNNHEVISDIGACDTNRFYLPTPEVVLSPFDPGELLLANRTANLNAHP